MMRKLAFWLLMVAIVVFGLGFAFALSGCPTPLPQPLPPHVDGGGGTDDCEAACATLTRLCEIPEDAGSSCVPACRNAEESGIITFCPKFVAAARTCGEAKLASQCDEAP